MTIPVDTGTEAGSLVTKAGQVQFGPMLLGGGTSAGWVNLTGWRDLPAADLSDALRPQAHGAYPGDVYGQSLTVTYDLLLRGLPDAKLADLATLEAHTRLGVRQPLVVDDGAGPTLRMGKVVARSIPMDKAFRLGPLACSVQWVCADPRRYGLAEQVLSLGLATASGGLEYPLAYPLEYGTSTGGSARVSNAGTEDTPLVAVLHGPLTDPTLSCAAAGWALSFDMTLAAGEALTIDTHAGTVKLGAADRLYAIAPASSPVEACSLPPGDSTVALSATAGTGFVSLTYRPAYL